ncbi:MAG: tRNA lysidine(34) synthetase TilS [Roseobacter sp.]
MSELIAHVAARLPTGGAKRLGVAVSGGGDSLALLRLLHQICGDRGIELICLTVDHGLRTEAREEAETVAKRCVELGIVHQLLVWQGWDGAGNVQNAARQARYALMTAWAKENDIDTIALGHTQDDQAETVLMRLARGAGVDGLSAMAPTRRQDGILWIRPLLNVSRAELRDYLRSHSETWAEDPSNEDARYERIKTRQILDQLSVLGIDRAVLGHVAGKMQSVRRALEHQTEAAAKNCVRVKAGGLSINWDVFSALPEEISRRLLIAGLKWIAGTVYAPRHKSIETALQAVQQGKRTTLEGCVLARKDKTLWVHREFNAVRHLKSPPGSLWDDRWQVIGPEDDPAVHIAALGEAGLGACSDWRDTKLPRALLLASPAVWKDDQLIAAPHAGKPENWCVNLQKGETSYFDTLISH